MKYLCAQPCNKYFIWQVETMLTSFEDVGVDLNDVIVAYAALELYEDTEQKYQAQLDKWVPKGVTFHNIADERKNKKYIPGVRPWIFKHLWRERPELEDEAIFYHDCDIALTKPLGFTKKQLEDDNWYVSDTVSYIGYDYIKQFDRDILDTFLDVFPGVTEKHAREQNFNSGGCHYLMKNIDATFWDNIERKSLELYERITDLQEGREQQFQIWPANMFTLLWHAWECNHTVKVHPKLNFTWAVDPIEKWDENAIFHCAGVVCDCDGLFFKGGYITDDVPPGLQLDKQKASYNYYKLIMKAYGHKGYN